MNNPTDVPDKDVFSFLTARVRELETKLGEAFASERHIWAAYAMSKGAAERACGMLGMISSSVENGVGMCHVAINTGMGDVQKDIVQSQEMAGVALE